MHSGMNMCDLKLLIGNGVKGLEKIWTIFAMGLRSLYNPLSSLRVKNSNMSDYHFKLESLASLFWVWFGFYVGKSIL